MILAVVLKILPFIMLLALVAIVPVIKQVKRFNQKQVKATTFSVAVKNLVLINGNFSLLLLVAVFL